MSEHPIEGLMTTAMNSIQDMIDVNTIIGDPIQTSNNVVIIPVSKVNFGFAAGGSEFKGKTIDINNYITESKDYTNNVSKLGVKVGELSTKFITKGLGSFFKVLSKLVTN